MSAQAVTEEPQVYFDDTRKALTFALNYEGEVKASTMTRMLAQVRKAPKKPGKAAMRRLLAGLDGSTREIAQAVIEAQFAPKRLTRKGPLVPRLTGLDAAHMAGYILAHFARLDPDHQTVLKGLACHTHDPCSCKAPCCSGWRQRPIWGEAVRDACHMLERAGTILVGDVAGKKRPDWAYTLGKRGISSPPALRIRVVMDFFQRRSTRLEDLATLGRVSVTTAARHKEWILTYLDQLETEAWAQLAALFDQAGITGDIL